jgi:hypothetical protein
LQRLNDPSATLDIKPLATHLDEMFDGYVMDKQRDQHSRAASGATSWATSGATTSSSYVNNAGGSKVELF